MRTRSKASTNRERAASVVEFALILPVLAVFLLGMMEATWAQTQNLDVRHGAREGARLASVNFNPANESGADQLARIVDETCTRLDDADATTVSIRLDNAADTTAGSSGTIRVTRTYDDLTGMLPFFNGLILDSVIEFRLEREASWTSGTLPCL
ncbi:MAG: pilus assembly protein [Acidimicrobiales bacterium]|nr:pilus assembly protein [Acidimicrobiales bacterium]